MVDRPGAVDGPVLRLMACTEQYTMSSSGAVTVEYCQLGTVGVALFHGIVFTQGQQLYGVYVGVLVTYIGPLERQQVTKEGSTNLGH